MTFLRLSYAAAVILIRLDSLGALTVMSLLAYRGCEDAYSSTNFLFVLGVTWEFKLALAAECRLRS